MARTKATVVKSAADKTVPPDYMPPPPKPKRKYTGPAKGSEEARERMAKVRAAQWAKNGLVVSKGSEEEE